MHESIHRDNGLNGSQSVCVRTASTAGEAAVMVETTHSLAGLVGSIHFLVTLNTDSWDKTKNNTKLEKKHEDTFKLDAVSHYISSYRIKYGHTNKDTNLMLLQHIV